MIVVFIHQNVAMFNSDKNEKRRLLGRNTRLPVVVVVVVAAVVVVVVVVDVVVVVLVVVVEVVVIVVVFVVGNILVDVVFVDVACCTAPIPPIATNTAPAIAPAMVNIPPWCGGG